MVTKNTPCNSTAARPLAVCRNNVSKIVVPVLLGPTASGKTALALELAESLDFEILSCDSRQIYRGMNIGTAKPSSSELQGVKHWLIDIVEPSEEYSAFRFAREALSIIRKQTAAGKKVLICGGTGLYFKALSEGGEETGESDSLLRGELIDFVKKNGATALHEELQKVDPLSATRIHQNDVQRVIRALAIYKQTGQLPSSLKKGSNGPDDIEFIIMKLSMSREILYKKIDRRVVTMFENGLWEEFLGLLKKGFNETSPGMHCIGYKELFDVYKDGISVEKAIECIQKNSRNYAKRQMTWLRTQVGGPFFESPYRYNQIKDFFSTYCW